VPGTRTPSRGQSERTGYQRGEDPLRVTRPTIQRGGESRGSVLTSPSRSGARSESGASTLRPRNTRGEARTTSTRAEALRSGERRAGTFGTASSRASAGQTKAFESVATQQPRTQTDTRRATDYGVRTSYEGFYNGFPSSREVRSLYYTNGNGELSNSVISASPRYRNYGYYGFGYNSYYGWGTSFGYSSGNFAISGSFGYPAYGYGYGYAAPSHYGLSAAAYYPSYGSGWGVGVSYSPTRTYLANGWYSQQAYWRTGSGIYVETVYRAPRYGWRRGAYAWCGSPYVGFHYRSYAGSRYRVCRPYYYFAPTWYGHYYSADRYSYYSSLEVEIDEAYEDGFEKGYDEGYEDAQDGSGQSSSPYRSTRRRATITTQQDPEERAYTARFEDLMDRGASTFHKGEYDRATELFRDASLADPNDVHARTSLGHAAFASGRYSLSAYSLRRALKDKPELAESGMVRRQHYTDPAIFDLHMQRLDSAWQKDDRNSDLAFLAGYNLYFDGEYIAAASALQEAVDLAPEDSVAESLLESARVKAKAEAEKARVE